MNKFVGAIAVVIGLLCIGGSYKLQTLPWAKENNYAWWSAGTLIRVWNEGENKWIDNIESAVLKMTVLKVYENDFAAVKLERDNKEVTYENWKFKGEWSTFYIPWQVFSVRENVANVENILRTFQLAPTVKAEITSVRVGGYGRVKALRVYTCQEENLGEENNMITIKTEEEDFFDYNCGLLLKAESTTKVTGNENVVKQFGVSYMYGSITLIKTNIPLATVVPEAFYTVLFWSGIALVVFGTAVIARTTITEVE